MKSFLALALLLGLALPNPAHAIRCSEWTRMGPGAKQATIARMIDSGMKSSNARRYDLNQARTQQCMRRNGVNIGLIAVRLALFRELDESESATTTP